MNQIPHSDEDYFSMGLFIERNSYITCFIYLLYSLIENDASCIRQVDPPVNACYSITAEMQTNVLHDCDYKPLESRILNSQEK